MTDVLVTMPKYESYKDSGVQGVGVMPAHWKVNKFLYLFTFGKGLTITK